MQESRFNIVNLWPDFEAAWIAPWSSQGFSSLFIGLMLVIFAGFMLFALFRSWGSARQVAYYRKLLDQATQDELLMKRREIWQAAQRKPCYAKLWREFDESLVVAHREDDPDQDRLSNTLDAHHFFNTHTLASGLIGNHLLSAIPGILTAIGVLGTFAGLQMGLADLELQRDAGVVALQAGISTMISGASVAFMTSVWGVFLSLAFNLVLKALETRVVRRISALQNQIDYLYPRINAEQSLVHIARSTERSDQALQELAEKIGDRMQESLEQVSLSIQTGIQESMQQVLEPAIQSMSDNATKSSEVALSSLTERFLEGFGNVGAQQRELMESASQQISQAASSMTDGMQEFLGQLREQAELQSDHERSRSEHFSESLQTLQQKLVEQLERQREFDAQRQAQYDAWIEGQQEQSSQHLGKLTEALEHQLQILHVGIEESVQGVVASVEQQSRDFAQRENERAQQLIKLMNDAMKSVQELTSTMGSRFEQLFAKQQQADEERRETFKTYMDSFANMHSDLTERVQNLVNTQHESLTGISDRLEQVYRQHDELAQSSQSAATQMHGASEQISGAAQSLEQLGTNIHQTASMLRDQVRQTIESVEQIAEQNSKVSEASLATLEHVTQVNSKIGDSAQSMHKLSQSLTSMATQANTAFDRMQDQVAGFLEGMQHNLDGFRQQITRLLDEYGLRVNDQVDERLGQWNQQTAAYIQTMTSAVNQIAEIVDDIDNALQARN